MGLSYILPLFKCMQYLSKFVLVFICDFVDAVKACEGNLYRLYVDPIMSYRHAKRFYA
jgi:hypothetical protein